MISVLKSIVSSVCAATVGLMTVLFVAMLWWEAGRGIQGILLGASTAAVFALLVRLLSSWPSSVLASFLGAAVASYLAIASAELMPPGSLEWAAKGGSYGAAVGLPLSAILGPLGVLGSPAAKNKTE